MSDKPEYISSGADISPCGKYRHILNRQWSDGPPCCFIMLNPSTADASKDDNTIKRCVSFAQREGYGGLVVVNLFDVRATKPKNMKAHSAPVSKGNDGMIVYAATNAGLVVAAWGNDGLHQNRAAIVEHKLREANIEVHQLGDSTKLGQPGHPLYLPDDIPLVKRIERIDTSEGE